MLDCYSQNTVQTEDGSCTPKSLLPPMNEEGASALACELLQDCALRWHGVFHPYFHPISLAGRGSVPCQSWFRQVLRTAYELGLPSVNAVEWLDFNDARRAVTVDTLSWDGETLVLNLHAVLPIAGLTLLLPPWPDGRSLDAGANGEPCDVLDLAYEGLNWLGLMVNLSAGADVEVRVAPSDR